MPYRHIFLGILCFCLGIFSPYILHTAIVYAAEAETPSPPAEEDPWALAWTNQRQYLQDIADAASAIRKDLPELTKNITRTVMPFEHESRRLFMLGTTYGSNPRVLEAVERRIADTSTAVQSALAPALSTRDTAQDLLDKVNQLEKTIPQELKNNASVSKDLRSYIDTLIQVKKRLEESIARIDNALTQGMGLVERVNKAQKEIDAYLPSLWEKQYLLPPIRYLDSMYWENLDNQLDAMAQNFSLRMVMEIPHNAQGWLSACVRFAVILVFGGLLMWVVYNQLRRRESGDTFLHIFKTSVPWLLMGIALLGASVTGSGNNIYRAFLSLGNILLIVGQISLAWDLRRIDTENLPHRSPFWRLCLPTLIGYMLMYPDLPIILLTISWAVVLVGSIILHRVRRPASIPLGLEKTVLYLDQAMLWLALFMVLVGLPRYSILFYMLFVTLAVALQLGMGSMHLVHAASRLFPQEGIRAVIGNLVIAFAAPLVLVLVATGVTLWIVTLPGGMYLLRHYAISGVSIGATQFNILQIFIIISGFYITRAAVSIGTTFLQRMPERGIALDATLIPPLVTAFTYASWTIFAAMVLKTLGVELSNIAVVAGGLSVGIGFGMQNIVNNFLSGLILIFSRILQEGDVIDVGGLNGVVRKISVRATTIETYDNAVIYVPNAEFVSSRLINWTRNSRSVRREIKVGVAYGSDIAKVMRILHEAADGCVDVLKHPAPTVLFSEFGASTLDFTMRFWVPDIDKGVAVSSALRVHLEHVFRVHGIAIAFPQLDVHIKEMPPVAQRPVRNQSSTRVCRTRPRRVSINH